MPWFRNALRSATAVIAAVVFALVSTIVPVAAAPQEADGEYFSTMRWRNIGPTRGGRSVAVSGVVGDDQTYYFGGTGGGVWKTTDAGQTWNNVSDGFFKTGSVGAIAVAESDSNVIYVGMGEHAVRGVTTSHGDGVYRSTDAGRTWTHVGLPDSRAISRIRIHPTNPDLVYVAAQGAPYGWTDERGIYRSRDGGATWERVHFVSERAGAADLAMDMRNPRILYAAYWEHIRRPWIVESGGEGSGIYKSTDGGDTWRAINSGLPDLMGKIGIDVSRASPDRVFAIVEAADGKGGLYRSDDAGRSWQQVNSERVIQTRSWYYMEVYADPTDADTVHVLNAPFMSSIDGGRTFTNTQVPHGDNHDLWISPVNGDNMINANDGGANVTFNGGRSWSTQRNQPTAQFYRVITDNQFPYHVYGGQQDNSAIGIASAAPGAIGWEHFYSVAGCESAYIAFDDEDDPRYVYGTCIQGDIDVWDRQAKSSKPIRPYPELSLGVNPIEQRYRFNWNNPVVASPHRKGVIYQAGNVLFRTEDRGQTWRAISPDLTRNDAEKQQIGGGPITNENAGGETYNTISDVTESAVDEGVLWVGTDDGLVHVSRDGGASWSDVTPTQMAELGRGTGNAPGEALVNAIEASPHAAGTAYLAVTRYKFNDFTPHIYRTTDFGSSWTRVVDGIADDHWVRVVREDPVRPGLLYAGTELGMYISFDRGDSWRAWQLNLPVVPITDLTIRNNDLVAATQGRAFWILDDLTPVQQLVGAPDQGHQLLTSRSTPMVQWGGFFPGGGPGPGDFPGQNPPAGAQIYFHLDALDEAPVVVEIVDGAGEVVRTYATDDEADGVSPLTVEPGLNRLVWDFRTADVEQVPDIMVFGSFAGRMVAPGRYEVRLRVGDELQTSTLELTSAPWITASTAQFAEQQAFMAELQELMGATSAAVNRMTSARQQLRSLADRLPPGDAAAATRDAARQLADRIEAWDGQIVQRKQETFQDVINFENQFLAQVLALAGTVDGTEPPVTAGARQRLDDLTSTWNEHTTALEALVAEIEAINASVREAGWGGVILSNPGEQP